MAQTIELTWLDNALENSCVMCVVLAFHNDLKKKWRCILISTHREIYAFKRSTFQTFWKTDSCTAFG